MCVAVTGLRLVENSDEHRRNILQAILRFRAIKEGGVLPEFVSHLVDDKGTPRPERVISILQQSALLFYLKNAKRNSGKNIVALRDTMPGHFLWKSGGIAIDHMYARIVGKLPFQIT